MRINLALTTALLALALPCTASGRAGDADPAFGLGGEAVADLGGGEPYVVGLDVAPDGAIVVAASEPGPFGAGGRDVLLRFTRAGRIERRIPVGVGIGAPPVVESDGGLLVAGSVATVDGTRFAVARYKRDGTPDRGFGDGGITAVPFPTQSSYATGVARDAAGRIVAGGTASDEFAVARLTPGGSLDPTFGDAGKTMSPVSSGISHARGMVLDGAGRAVLFGDGMELDADGHSWQSPLIARYSADGLLDDEFGQGGIVRLPVETHGASATGAVVQPDGRLVVTVRGARGLPLFRYQPDGALDPSFGNGGDATTHPNGLFGGMVLARQPDGRLLVSAEYGAPRAVGGWALARVLPGGGLDSSFAGDGVFVSALGADYWWPAGLGIQPGGGIVQAGTSMSCGRRVISLIRIKAGSGGPSTRGPAIRGCDPTASKNGKIVSLIVDCPLLAAVCKGRVALRHGRVRIGEHGFDLRGNHRYALLRIRARRGAKPLLAGSKRLPATAAYSVSGKTGRARTVVRRVTIRR